MKKLLLLLLLFVIGIQTNAFSQVAKKVLVEEFTSSTCPPCKATDPTMEEFESVSFDKICVLKWHVNWPSPGNDPFYKDFTGSVARSTNYYANNYAPHLFFNGKFDKGIGTGPAWVDLLDKTVDSAAAVGTSPYSMTLSQSIVGDSLIVNLTVKAEGTTMPSETDLRLAVVAAERFNPYMGTNGSPFHTNVVRGVIPGLTSTGGISTNAKVPAFTLNVGETRQYTLAIKIGATWNREQLMAVAFIQSFGTKEIFQTEWTVPANVVITPVSTGLYVTGDGQNYAYQLENKSSKAIDLILNFSSPTMPANWGVKVDGLPADNKLSLAANETRPLILTCATIADAVGMAPYTIFANSAIEHIGVTGTTNTAFGIGNRDIIVDAGSGTANCTALQTSINAANSMYKTAVVPRATFEEGFADWSKFRTIVYYAGATTGLYSDGGTWEKLGPFLQGGGHFLMSSSVAITAYYNSGNEPLMDLWRTNFHIEPTGYDNTQGWSTLVGVANDPLSNGINTTVASIATTQVLTPSDAKGIGCFKNDNDEVVGMRSVDGTGKTVMLTFGINNIKSADRNSVTKKIMDWFDGTASVKTSDEASAFTMKNSPNPAITTTTITYSLTERAPVSLVVRDVMGREVARLVSNEIEDAGTYTAGLDVSKLANGSYFYTLSAGGKSLTGTVLVTK